MSIKTTIHQQRAFFNSNITKDIQYRKKALKRLEKLLQENETALYTAIYSDFQKSEFETYTTELSIIYHEISVALKKLSSWAKPKRVASDMLNFPSKSYIYSEPLGSVLIIGAWNYPYGLSLAPVITALAAGNTVILKPSEISIHTSNIMAKLINENFDSHYFCVIEGGVETTTEILEEKFDKIFFTGSTMVGRIVYQAAAKYLTPVVLELGGKSPTFILKDADITISAKRIVWAKFLNAGQTCVAPDYLLIEDCIKEKFVQALKKEIDKQFSQLEDNYVQIINERNFKRLESLIEEEKVIYGNKRDPQKRLITPTLLDNVTFEDKIMQEEIFGPLLPIISFDNLDDVIKELKTRPKPLSCYIYTQNSKCSDKIIQEFSFGGGAINDSVMHLTSENLPFGGVGESGMGSYHGKFGFDEFSHFKSILKKNTFFEFPIKYAPYSAFKLKIIKILSKA